MGTDLEQFYEVFFEESSELLAEMEACLLGLDVNSPDAEDLNAIFRAAHSIKGGAGTFGFTDMTEMTHILETLLDRLRKGELEVRSEMIDAFLKAGDLIKWQLAGHRGDGQADPAAAEVCEELSKFSEETHETADAAEAVSESVDAGTDDHADENHQKTIYCIEFPNESVSTKGRGNLLSNLGGLGKLEKIVFGDDEPLSKLRLTTEYIEDDVWEALVFVVNPDNLKIEIEADDKSQLYVEDGSKTVNAEIKEPYGFFPEAPGNTTKPYGFFPGSPAAPTDVQEPEEKPETPKKLVNDKGAASSKAATNSAETSSIRVSIEKVDQLINLVGESTELDKGLIEKIADPLTHLIRNSLDHGVEMPDDRVALGKPAMGTITLRAFHQGGNIVIEVSDDGAGLNRDKILAKAKERGLSVHDGMPDADVWMLIFEAGFSTAAVVTDVSGRGVGMDVVKRNIAAMGGRVEIDSALGVGTRISIRLPLTLAILDGLSVGVGDQMFIVPLTYIVESLQPTAEDIKKVSGRGRVVQVRGEYLPVTALHEIFNLRPTSAEIHDGILVILEAEGQKAAMLVDTLIGQHQVVIKSLESNYRRVQSVSGATIMGDGKVALILDTAALVTSSQEESV